jgi:probable rRNA maturation factor
MPSINYFYHKVNFKLKEPRKLTSWIKRVVEKEGATIQEINYVFCTDTYLLNLNKGFLKHNTFTDIITFDNAEEGSALEGEIYISFDRVQENAEKYRVRFEDELNRVMIHGVLHLLGYKDKKPSEKALMRKKEEACLSLRK